MDATYPRTLVMRLVKEGRVGAGTEERVLAIMFTDIAGFTAVCEKMSAGEVAAFINQHLTLVSACVEQEGGTIDKFIGDAVMAFWGAPGRAENPAASACRAAIAIQRRLRRTTSGGLPRDLRRFVSASAFIWGRSSSAISARRTGSTTRSSATPLMLRKGWRASARPSTPMPKRSPWSASEIFAALPPSFQLIERGTHLVKGKAESLDVYQLVGRLDRSASQAHAG